MKTQTIEKTSKRLKAQILASWAFIIIGLVGVAAPTSLSGSTVDLVFPAMLIGGIVWLIVTKIRIWWNHG